MTAGAGHLGRRAVPDGDLGSPCAPVPLVATIDGPDQRFAFVPEAGALRRLTWRGVWSNYGGTLFDHGRSYVFASKAPIGSWKQVRHTVHTWSFIDGQITQIFETDRPRTSGTLVAAGSPDGHRLAILEIWHEPSIPRGPESANVTLWTRLGTGTWDDALTVHGTPAPNADGPFLQWSPDSGRVAVNLLHLPSGAPRWISSVHLVDPAGAEPNRHFEDCQMIGSLSWSPDGQRLLVTDPKGALSDLHLTTGLIAPTACLPHTLLTHVNEARRPLGYANDTQLIVARQRGKHLTIALVNRDTADESPRLTIGPGTNIYPVLADTPDHFWTLRERESHV